VEDGEGAARGSEGSSMNTMSQPAFARATVISRPRPPVEPVAMAVLPERLNMVVRYCDVMVVSWMLQGVKGGGG
jgi:hypothetical protein